MPPNKNNHAPHYKAICKHKGGNHNAGLKRWYFDKNNQYYVNYRKYSHNKPKPPILTSVPFGHNYNQKYPACGAGG